MTDSGCSVLVIEDDADFARLTSLQLQSAGHAVVTVSTMHEALELLERSDGERYVMLLDLGLPDIGGLDSIRAAVDSGECPVIVYTGGDDPTLRARAAELGAAAFLVKGTMSQDRLDAQIREVVAASTRATATRRADDNVDARPEHAVRATCEMLGLATGLDCWALVRDLSGRETITVSAGPSSLLQPGQRVQWDPRLSTAGTMVEGPIEAGPIATTWRGEVRAGAAHIAVVPGNGGVLLGWTEQPDGTAGPLVEPLAAFAADQIATLDHLASRWATATRRADLAGVAASVDVLTGLGNRRGFDRHLRAEEAYCHRHDLPGLVAVLDLDELKIVNDRDGHASGDQLLQSAATALLEAMRTEDAVFRIGGDEFAVVVVGCGPEQAFDVVDRLRSTLDTAGVRASLGWATRPPEVTFEDAFAAADRAMYEDKDRRRASGPHGDPSPSS